MTSYYIIRDNETDETLSRYHKSNPDLWTWSSNYHDFLECGEDRFCSQDVQTFRTHDEARHAVKHLERAFLEDGAAYAEINFEIIKVSRKTIVVYERE